MTNVPYSGAVASHGARVAAAMARLFRGHRRRAADRARIVVERLQMLGRLSPGLGIATVMRSIDRPAPQQGVQQGAEDRRSAVLVPLAARAMVRCASEQREGWHPARRAVGLRRTMPGARAADAALGVEAVDSPAAWSGCGPRLMPFALAKYKLRRFAPDAAGGKSISGGTAGHLGVQSRATRMAEGLRSEAVHRGQTFAEAGISARLGRHTATPSSQQGGTPGFQHTVRQARAAAPAGNVYLDRALVGYHLAAAITAEQTRAAARPNISGSSFNSSMAVLRPSGASL